MAGQSDASLSESVTQRRLSFFEPVRRGIWQLFAREGFYLIII